MEHRGLRIAIAAVRQGVIPTSPASAKRLHLSVADIVRIRPE